MLGNPANDQFKVARGNPGDAANEFYRRMRQVTLDNHAITTDKLNNMYNKNTMPVYYLNASQVAALSMRQQAAPTNFLSVIQFPKRMPYSVTPR